MDATKHENDRAGEARMDGWKDRDAHRINIILANDQAHYSWIMGRIGEDRKVYKGTALVAKVAGVIARQVHGNDVFTCEMEVDLSRVDYQEIAEYWIAKWEEVQG